MKTPTGEARFAELLGDGYAKRNPKECNAWQRLVNAYMRERDSLKLVLHLVDFRHGLLKNDKDIHKWIKACGKDVFVVFSKSDKYVIREARSD